MHLVSGSAWLGARVMEEEEEEEEESHLIILGVGLVRWCHRSRRYRWNEGARAQGTHSQVQIGVWREYEHLRRRHEHRGRRRRRRRSGVQALLAREMLRQGKDRQRRRLLAWGGVRCQVRGVPGATVVMAGRAVSRGKARTSRRSSGT